MPPPPPSFYPAPGAPVVVLSAYGLVLGVLFMLGAAAVSAFNPLLDKVRRLLDGIAVATAAGVTGILLAVLVSTGGHGPERVYWFAGFWPHNGVAIGIDFAVGPLNAGIAALSALLVTAAMVFSWRYFEQVSTYFYALMLVFLAGMATSPIIAF